MIEFCAALYFSGEIAVLDFNNRIVKELQMQQFGKIELSTGTYTGETDFGNFNGQGIFSFITGAVYSGEWKDNQIAGQGILEVPDEGTYEGAFQNGKKEGEGTFTWKDGSTYQGVWKKDQMNGKGVFKNHDGTCLPRRICQK